MKRNSNILIATLLILCIMSACDNNTAKLDYRQNISRIQSELLPIEQLIGHPHDIICMDTLLIYADRYEGKQLSIFDLKNNRFVGRFVSEGQGPNEVIPSIRFVGNAINNELQVYQDNPAILSTLNPPNFTISKNIPFKPSASWQPFEIQRTKDYYVGAVFFDKRRFGIYDSEGQPLHVGGVYPFDGKDMETTKATILYQSRFCANPGKNFFAAGCAFSDHIAFYEVNQNEIITLKEYYSYKTTAKYINYLITENDCIINYTEAYGTDSCCYMLFSGQTFGENGGRTRCGRYIIVFDWQGNYIKTLETDCEIINFCVDEPNRRIYAIALDKGEDYRIVKYKI